MQATPLYIAETATKEMRGTLGSGVQLAITVGIFLVYVLGGWLGFRSLAACGFVIPIISVLLIMRIPETPRFCLISRNKVIKLNKHLC